MVIAGSEADLDEENIYQTMTLLEHRCLYFSS
jgi:hypothetical protein